MNEINAAIEAIHSNTNPRKHNTLKEKCKEILDVLQKLSEKEKKSQTKLLPYQSVLNDSDPSGSDSVRAQWDALAHRLVEVLDMACETRSYTIVDPALDCLEHLLVHGFLREHTPFKQGMLLGHVISIIVNCYKFSEGRSDPIVKALLAAVKSPNCGLHGIYLLEAFKAVHLICASSHTEPNRAFSKGALTEMLNIIFQQLISLPTNTPTTTEMTSSREGELKYSVQYQDCYLVFRTLYQPESDGGSTSAGAGNEGLTDKTKLLSLDLISGIFENFGKNLRKISKFVKQCVRPLCGALVGNFFSPVNEIFRLVLAVFLELVILFRKDLKPELAVLLEIFLRILESNDFPFHHKQHVVQTFIILLRRDPLVLLDLFVNYDCDLKSSNVFFRMMEALSKTAKGGRGGSGGGGGAAAGNEQVIVRMLGVDCMVAVAKVMVEWSKVHNDLPESDKMEICKNSDQNSEKEVFEGILNAKEKKKIIEKGKSLFNFKAKNGVSYMIEHKIISDTPEDIAALLRNTPGLDKTKIGEYLGEVDFDKVLNFYVENHFHFKGMEIDIALRELLQTFLLPGESQKVDRVMEKFASRYFEDNKERNLFKNSDSVHLLAFGIIMLTTDLHNPQVKVKITLPAWKKMLLVDENSYGFDEKMLDEIFQRIAAEPMKLLEDTRTVDKPGPVSEKERQILYNQEKEAIYQHALNLYKLISATKERISFVSFGQTYFSTFIRLMVKDYWRPALACFSVILQESDDPKIVSLSLEGFKAAIRVTSMESINTGRRAFILALTKFTSLDGSSEILDKHIDAINTLIEICTTDGNHLRDSWKTVLRTISQLEQMHVIGSIGKSDSLDSNQLFNMRKNSKLQSITKERASTIASNIRSSDIDLIFGDTKKLQDQSILDVVQALIEISNEEFNMDPPQFRSLEKLVLLAVENMPHRIRLVWTLLAQHFTNAGQHKNKEVANIAITSLNLLSLKFLQDDELSNYDFQKEFLKPFEEIAKTTSRSVRGFVVECLCAMVAKRASNIKSGWKTILNVFAQQANLSKNEDLVGRAFGMLCTIYSHYFSLLVPHFFVDYVQALHTYCISKQNQETRDKAIQLIQSCAEKLAGGEVCELSPDEEEGPNKKIFRGSSTQHVDLWLSVVNGLVLAVNRTQMETREIALKCLFKLLKTQGHLFDCLIWEILFKKSILRLFDRINCTDAGAFLGDSQEDTDWLLTTCFRALHEVIGLYSMFTVKVSFFLHEILRLVVACLLSENEILSQFGVTAFGTLLQNNTQKFTREQWTHMISSLTSVLRQNTPHHIFSLRAPNPLGISKKGSSQDLRRDRNSPSGLSDSAPAAPASSDLVHSTPQSPRGPYVRSVSPRRNPKKETPWDSERIGILNGICRNRNYLISMISDQIISRGFRFLETAHVISVMEAMMECYSFALSVNSDPKLQREIFRMTDSVLTDLIGVHEQESMSCYLLCLFQLHAESEKDQQNRHQIADELLIKTCTSVVKSYMDCHRKLTFLRRKTVQTDSSPPPTYEEIWLEKIIQSKIPVIVLMLSQFAQFRNDQLLPNLSVIYPLLCDLSLSESFIIRKSLREVLLRIGKTKLGEFSYKVVDTSPLEHRAAVSTSQLEVVDNGESEKPSSLLPVVVEEAEVNQEKIHVC